MLTMSTGPSAAIPNMSTPLFTLWSDVAGVYGEAMKANAQQLMLSSAGVIQEQMLRAIISTSQCCADALAKNAMSVQQQSMERFAEANGKVAGLMGQAFTQAWIENMRPVTPRGQGSRT